MENTTQALLKLARKTGTGVSNMCEKTKLNQKGTGPDACQCLKPLSM